MPSDLEAAYHIAAQIVVRDGDAFLPVFLRLEQAMKALEGNISAIERAKALSQSRAA